jgi:hypothetical protein
MAPGIHDYARAWALRTGWQDARGDGTGRGRQSILVLDAWRAAGSPRDLSEQPPSRTNAVTALCLHCAGPLPASRRSDMRYCCGACRAAAARATPELLDPAELATLGWLEMRYGHGGADSSWWRPCAWCSAPIGLDAVEYRRRGQARYCSPRCRTAACRARRQAA